MVAKDLLEIEEKKEKRHRKQFEEVTDSYEAMKNGQKRMATVLMCSVQNQE